MVFKPRLISAPPALAKQTDREMNAVMKDIISPTYLPSIDSPALFNILAYVKESASVADAWEDTHLHTIGEDGENDTLKPLKTTRHTVGLSVAYCEED